MQLEVFGQSAQCLVSKAGKMYVKFTAVTKDDNNQISSFVNCCAFPEQEDCVKLRDYLVQGRLVTATGNYSEREYEKKDGSGTAIAKDLLCHSLKLGDVVEYTTEGKTTDYSFITKEAEARAKSDLKKNSAKQAKKPAKASTSVTMPGVEPEYSPADDELFNDIDL